MERRIAFCLLVFAASASTSLGEFAVNEHTTYDQKDAATAADEEGNFVVVWNSYEQDGDSGGIFGRRFDANGYAAGGEFQINATSAGNQGQPDVAMDGTGNFVVTWHGPAGPNDSNEDIFARRFDSNGAAVGDDFRVNTYTAKKQRFAKVAMNKEGAAVFVWESDKTLSGPESYAIACRIYDVNGDAVAEEFDGSGFLECSYPDVAMDGSGDFAVTWMQKEFGLWVMLRRFNADGSAKDFPEKVNVADFSSVTRPAIAMGDSGHFVVCWDGHPGGASLDDVYARRYLQTGVAVGEPFVVNTRRSLAQDRPAVAMNILREFVVAWQCETGVGGVGREIFGQRYDAFWNRVGDEFHINTYLVEDQRYPAVMLRDDGVYVTVWQSYGQDGSRDGVYGQMGPEVGCVDLWGDLTVDFRDFCVLAKEWLKDENPLRADLVDDNVVDEKDLGAFGEQWLTACYSCDQVDMNGDRKIDFRDYASLAGDWSQMGPGLVGDITGDGIVEAEDLRAMVFYWAQRCEGF